MWRHSAAAVLFLTAFLVSGSHAWELSVKDVRAPLFVYGREKNNICIVISNTDRWSARTATVVLTMKPKGAPEKKIKRSFSVRNKGKDSILIPFDMADTLAETAMQRRVIREILADRLIDAIELPFNDTFLRLTASG